MYAFSIYSFCLTESFVKLTHWFFIYLFPFPPSFLDVLQVSIMNNVNTSVGNTSVGEEEYTLYGKSTITEILRGLTFQISANSFFQTNTHQACEVTWNLY